MMYVFQNWIGDLDGWMDVSRSERMGLKGMMGLIGSMTGPALGLGHGRT